MHPEREQTESGSGARAGASNGVGRAHHHIRTWGVTAWRLVGILVAIAMVYSLVVAFSGVVIPLVLAAVIGALGVPAVDRLERHHVPRPAGAMVLIAALGAVIIATIVLIVRGVADEATEIRLVVTRAFEEIDGWLPNGGFTDDASSVVDSIGDQGSSFLVGAASWATTIFSGALAFGIGTFLALFMLYYILVDWPTVRSWLAGHLGVRRALGEAILDDAVDVVRRGFGALTITSLVIAAVIGSAMWVLDLPLVLAVTVVTFLTSYVPYLGAILSGGFAFMIALGSGGLQDAVIVLLVVLVAQNVIQTIVGNRLTSDRLRLHPLPSILSSVCGVAIAGLIGAVLSAPALALVIAVRRRVAQPDLLQTPTPSGPVSSTSRRRGARGARA